MYRHRAPATVLASAFAVVFAIACAQAPAAPDGSAAGPNGLVLDATSSEAETTAETMVEIKSEHLTGTLPNGLAADVNVKVRAEGSDPSSLTGDGRHFASTGAHNYWPATGSTDGTRVTLAGAVTESNTFFLIGSPVRVEADASTDAITLRFGPLAGGPFAGRTLIFSGTGKTTITREP